MRINAPLNSPVSLRRQGVRAFALLLALGLAWFGARTLAAQAPATAAKPSAALAPATRSHRPEDRNRPHRSSQNRGDQRPGAAHSKPRAASEAANPEASLPVTPPAPVVPLWPVNEKADPASVRWDSQGLRIEADNSSLAQILSDVATATGAKVEGLSTDQRIFGDYGPGPARDVLSQLFEGSGYNIVLIGEQGQGTPIEIVLSLRQTGAALPPTASPAPASDEDTDTEDQPAQPPPARSGFGFGGPRIPPQVQQQTQQREQQMQPPDHPQN